MKKLLYSVIGLATLLFAAGCQREVNTTADDENIVEVTFNVGLDGIRTKADANYSTGTGATKLDVLVYNTTSGEGVYLPNVSKTGEKAITPAFQNAGLTQNVTLKLIKGASYEVLFWAQNPNSTAYTLDAAAGTITVAPGTEEVPVPANDETRDAFFGRYTGAVTASFTETVELKRPFAQINVLDRIDDWNAALDNSIAFAGSSMTVTAPTVLNLSTGAATEPAMYYFGPAAVDTDNPNIAGYGDDDKGPHYKYIAMNYILAADQVNTDVEFKVYNGDLTSDELFAYPVANVPYQRNYRTNIIGDIFSADGIFTVVIKPAYEEPDYVVTMGIPVTIDGDSPLAAAIEAGSATFDETSKTGTVSLVLNATEATTLDFGAVIPADNLDIKPTYTSSDVTVGTIDEDGVFTALKAGTTVITIHYNAIADGVEVKGANGPDYDATDIIFEVTVAGEAPVVEPTLYTVTISDALVGGTIEADAESAPAEDIVLLTITPADGYHYVPGSVTVTGVEFADMQEEITDTDITVAFPMPEQNVVVSATFEEDAAPGPGPEPVSNGSGTLEDPFTIAGVKAYIDNNGADKVYVKGKISQIDQQFAALFGNITCWISDDGTTNDFEIYRALYLGNRKWVEGDTEAAVGDEVIVYGNVTLYTKDEVSTYETSSGKAYVYSLNGVSEVVAPTFSVAEGAVESGTTVKLIAEDADAIYYTLDGTAPTTASTKYTAPLTISEAVTIKAFAVKEGFNPSVVVTAAYTIAAAGEKEVTFTPENCTNISSSQAEQTQVLSDVTMVISSGVNNTQIRVYKNATATFTVANGYKITSIVFTCTANGTSQYGPGNFAELDGYSYEGSVGTWTGNASSVVFTASGSQVRATSIKVTYVAE